MQPVESVKVKKISSFKQWIRLVICGICMGAIDIVPGISGGTVAFIMGFYLDFLDSIKSINAQAIGDFFTLRFSRFFKIVEWEFLSALFTGIFIAGFMLAGFFNSALKHEIHRVYLYSVFLGLISAAIIFCARKVTVWKWYYPLMMIAGAVFTYELTQLDMKPLSKEKLFNVQLSAGQVIPGDKKIDNFDSSKHMLKNVSESTLSAMWQRGVVSGNSSAYDLTTQTLGEVQNFVSPQDLPRINWWIAMCGVIAICAMLMPGISGSYLLTILGIYPLLISSLSDLIEGAKNLTLDHDAFFVLFSLMIGNVIGALTFSRIVSWLLRHYRNLMIATMTGFMIGAIRTVWPFYTYAYYLLPLKPEKGPQLFPVDPYLPSFDSPLFWKAFLLTLSGFCLVLFVEFLANRKAADTAV